MSQKKEIRDVGQYIPHAKKHNYEQRDVIGTCNAKNKEVKKLSLSVSLSGDIIV